MDLQPEILYLKDRGEIWSDLIAGFHAYHFKLNVVRTVEDVLEALERKSLSVLIIDASFGDAEAERRAAQLPEVLKAALRSTAQIPIVFIAPQASRRTASMKSGYDRFVAIDAPFVVSEVIRSVRSALRAVLAISALHGTSSSHRTQPADLRALAAAAQFPKSVDPANLGGFRGGWTLSRGSHLSDFDDSVLVPAHPEKRVLVATLEETTEEDLWLGLHARRAAFSGAAVSNHLGRNAQRDQNIRATSLLVSWGLLEQSPRDRRVSLFGEESEETRRLFAQALRVSAEKASEKIRDQGPIRTMVAMSSLLVNERFSENQEVVQDARFTLATEIVDRACWAEGTWSPHGAYRALKEFRTGNYSFLSTPVVTGFSRLICEAALANPMSAMPPNLDKHMLRKREERVAKAIHDAERVFGKDAPRGVYLAELKPKMRLARPLLSMDGEVVLPSNVELNADIIMQVWRLASIRPLEVQAQIAMDVPPELLRK